MRLYSELLGHQVKRIFASVNGRNAGSRRVLEKNGYFLEAVSKDGIFKDGVFDDEFVFSKICQ